MRKMSFGLIALTTALALTPGLVFSAELTSADVSNKIGDGPDGKGNTADDTWQFWLELVHAKGKFIRLDRYSTDVPKAGVKGKITGPIAGMMPSPDDTEGWIYHSDWDGRFEGVWADKSKNEVLAYPYVEKGSHEAVAITYTVPESGTYKISGGVTDAHVWEYKKHDGLLWILEVANQGDKVKELAKGKPIGDGGGRPESDTFNVENVELEKGQLVRLVIDPINWWGSDMARIDSFKIEKTD